MPIASKDEEAALSPAFHSDEQEGLYVGGQFLDRRAATPPRHAEPRLPLVLLMRSAPPRGAPS
jgi:hypothetical protein